MKTTTIATILFAAAIATATAQELRQPGIQEMTIQDMFKATEKHIDENGEIDGNQDQAEITGMILKPEKLKRVGTSQFATRVRYRGKMIIVLVDTISGPELRRGKIGALKTYTCKTTRQIHCKGIGSSSRHTISGKVTQFKAPEKCKQCDIYAIGHIIINRGNK